MLTGGAGSLSTIDVELAHLFSDLKVPHIHLGVESNAQEGHDKKISRLRGGLAKSAEDDIERVRRTLFADLVSTSNNGKTETEVLLETLNSNLSSLSNELGEKTNKMKAFNALSNYKKIFLWRFYSPVGKCERPQDTGSLTSLQVRSPRWTTWSMVWPCGLSQSVLQFPSPVKCLLVAILYDQKRHTIM